MSLNIYYNFVQFNIFIMKEPNIIEFWYWIKLLLNYIFNIKVRANGTVDNIFKLIEYLYKAQ